MAIKIHPIQERLRHGKNPPPKKEKHDGILGMGSEEAAVPKGTYGGRCNVTACQGPGAWFYNTGTRAYYCNECALDIHRASRLNLDWMKERMMVYKDPNPEKYLDGNTVETAEDVDHLFNRRLEARMAQEWSEWTAQ